MVEYLTGRESVRVLLLQIRDEESVRREEHQSFARYSGLAEHQIAVLNVFDNPDFEPAVIDGYQALFVGGGSEASVLEPEHYPFLEAASQLLLHCLKSGIPVFASCFGFQLATLALGGEIIRDKDDFEMGSIPIRLTPAARQDPLFHDTPDPFMGISVHKERAIREPPGTVKLAYTSACTHAFRVPEKPFWAFQFHPEVDRQVLIDRLTVYQASYTEGSQHLAQVLSTAQETPASNALVKKFIDRIVLGSESESI